MTPQGRSPFYSNFAEASAPCRKVSDLAAAAKSRPELYAGRPQAGESSCDQSCGGTPCIEECHKASLSCVPSVPDKSCVQEWQTTPLSRWCWKSYVLSWAVSPVLTSPLCKRALTLLVRPTHAQIHKHALKLMSTNASRATSSCCDVVVQR